MEIHITNTSIQLIFGDRKIVLHPHLESGQPRLVVSDHKRPNQTPLEIERWTEMLVGKPSV